MNALERRRTGGSTRDKLRDAAAADSGALAAQRRIAELQLALSNERIELEVRDEELRRTQLDAERADGTQRVLRALFDAAPTAHLTIDARGAVTRANSAACELLKIAHARLIGLRFGTFVPECSWDTFADQLATPQRADTVSCELWLKCWNDDRCYVRMDSARASPQTGELLVLLTDLSDRQQLQLALEASKRGLEAPLQQIEPSQQLGVRAAGIAHDFNNLLVGVVIGADEILRAPGLPDALRQALGLIARTAGDAAELSRQLVAPSLAACRPSEAIDLAEVVAHCSELLRLRLRPPSGGIALQVQLDAELPPVALGRLPLQRLVMNLLTNAAEALGDRGVIRICAHSATLDARALEGFPHAHAAPGRFALLQIADTGPGIDGETLGHVFERFVTTKTAGRGLGLAVVVELVKQSAGALRVTSHVGRGTTFEIALPLATTPQPRRSALQSRKVESTGSESLLLIDDDRLVAAATSRALRSLGFEVTTADSGKHGLATFMAAQCPFDVVLLDWLMPGLSGDRVLAELRRLQPDLPVVVMSGLDHEHTLAHDKHVVHVLKPASVSELSGAIRRALDSKLTLG